MGRVLVTKNNVNSFIHNDECFYMENNMILSPYAKDLIRDKGLKIIYGNSNLSDSEKLHERIKNILVNEFQINDEDKINPILKKVMAELK